MPRHRQNLRWTPFIVRSIMRAGKSRAAVMDIVVWLRSLGLGQYEAVFRQNDIDETVLPNLTAEDLKELGVASLGHRRKLLDAIAALRTDAGAKGPSTDPSTTSATQIASPEDRAAALSFTPPQNVALIAEMLSLPNDGRHPTLELAPQQRRQKTLEALATQLEALSRSNPVLMIFEDVHWIDPTSLEALGRTVERIRSLSVLLIVTYRPEFEPPWIGQPHVTALTLNRLGERQIDDLIDRVIGNRPLPEPVRQGHYRAHRWRSVVR